MSPRWLMLSAVVILGSFAMFAMFCFGETLGSRKQHRKWVKAQEYDAEQTNSARAERTQSTRLSTRGLGRGGAPRLLRTT